MSEGCGCRDAAYDVQIRRARCGCADGETISYVSRAVYVKEIDGGCRTNSGVARRSDDKYRGSTCGNGDGKGIRRCRVDRSVDCRAIISNLKIGLIPDP